MKATITIFALIIAAATDGCEYRCSSDPDCLTYIQIYCCNEKCPVGLFCCNIGLWLPVGGWPVQTSWPEGDISLVQTGSTLGWGMPHSSESDLPGPPEDDSSPEFLWITEGRSLPENFWSSEGDPSIESYWTDEGGSPPPESDLPGPSEDDSSPEFLSITEGGSVPENFWSSEGESSEESYWTNEGGSPTEGVWLSQGYSPKESYWINEGGSPPESVWESEGDSPIESYWTSEDGCVPESDHQNLLGVL